MQPKCNNLRCLWRRLYKWSNVSKYFANFYAGDIYLNNYPRLWRPSVVNSKEITTLFENNQHQLTREKAKILKTISRSNTENRLYLFGYVSHFDFRINIYSGQNSHNENINFLEVCKHTHTLNNLNSMFCMFHSIALRTFSFN